MKSLKKYWLYTFAGVLVTAFYPLYMGVLVIFNMTTYGFIPQENYPKYIIPYTPICLAVIAAVILMPFFIYYAKKFALWAASAVSLCIFFIAELLLESRVIVTETVETTLESWQMYMCYVPPQNYETRTWKAVDILIGEYNPLFKFHFYLISVIIILCILNCLYGFAQIILTQKRTRLNALIIQSVFTVLFVGLCILACFTAFFRDGDITVSTLSASLMSLFFVTFGIMAGIYIGSFLLGRKKNISIVIPSVAASLTTFIMYIGELFLLSGHLYRFGKGLLFNGIPSIILAPVDILLIVLSGCITATITLQLNK